MKAMRVGKGSVLAFDVIGNAPSGNALAGFPDWIISGIDIPSCFHSLPCQLTTVGFFAEASAHGSVPARREGWFILQELPSINLLGNLLRGAPTASSGRQQAFERFANGTAQSMPEWKSERESCLT